MALVQEVRQFLETRGFTKTPGVVAVSGGADSIALARALVDADVAPITIVHINHQLRGEESQRDEAFVVTLAQRIKQPCVTRQIIVAEGNLENQARVARYQTLQRIAMDLNAGWVATGHTADDQAETLIHRLVRGTGLTGLRGIAAVRPITWGSKIQLIRPMLNVTRQGVEQYLLNLSQPFCTDSTNADVALTRNRIRHEIMPLLKAMNPNFVQAIADTAAQANVVMQCVDEQVQALLKVVERPKAGVMVVLLLAPLQTVTSALGCELFRSIWLREGWPMQDMTIAHWQRVARLTPGDYPGGIRLDNTATVVRLSPRS